MKVSHRYLAVVLGLLLEGAWIPPRSEPFSGRQVGGGDGQTAALPPPCPQGTLTAWHETRQAEILARIDVPLAALPSSLQTLRDRGVTLCCIDTAPIRLTKTRPCSSLPIWCWCRSGRVRRVAATIALLNQTGRPFLFVLNQVTLNANITARLPPPYLIMDESHRSSSPAVSAIPRL
jgi:hypothetical protein